MDNTRGMVVHQGRINGSGIGQKLFEKVEEISTGFPLPSRSSVQVPKQRFKEAL